MRHKIAVLSPSFLKEQRLVDYVKDRFQLVDLADCPDGVIVGLDKIDATFLNKYPTIKFVAKYGVGLDNIDTAELAKRDVRLGWTGGVNARSVAELTLCYTIGHFRNVFKTNNAMRFGEWNKDGGTQLSRKRVGIIGFGNVGQEVARLLQPFDCTIYANDIISEIFCHHVDMVRASKELNVLWRSKDEIYESCDVITLHVPLTKYTRHLINDAAISKMKKTALVINTSRGDVVDMRALKHAIQFGLIGGAALDVYDVEPFTDTHFITQPNVITTPHIGGNSREAVLAMGYSAIQHLESYFYGD